MPNPIFFTCLLNMIFVNTSCRYTQLNDQALLFLTIQFKLLQILLYISNNSNKHQSFVYPQLNDQIVLFLTIKSFVMSHLFAYSLNIKQFYLTHR